MNTTSRSSEVQRMPEQEGAALIRVVGVGGGGSNAVNRMIEESIAGVDFIAVNTDQQALMGSRAKQRVAIGERTTRGLGSGGDPEVGEKVCRGIGQMICIPSCRFRYGVCHRRYGRWNRNGRNAYRGQSGAGSRRTFHWRCYTAVYL